MNAAGDNQGNDGPNPASRRMAGALAVACLAMLLAAGAGAQEGSPRLRALLVGCSAYPNLDASLQLEGPANDVNLMWWTLTRRFGADSDDIVVLAETFGDEEFRPTRGNIVREMERLIEEAGPRDQVLILVAGHGSQQPDDDPDNPEDPEPDGFDEIFLPADVGAWDGGRGTVENAIVDDEWRAWLGKLTARGTFVWFIADTCHSGSILRGGGGERLRQVPPGSLVPAEALAEAAAAATERTPGGAGSEAGSAPASGIAGGIGENWVALYAAQSTEPTVERLMPPGQPDQQSHGILTYSLCRILSRAESPLTYAELAAEIQRQYAAWGRTFPTPLLEGPGRDREVLGIRSWPDRSRISLSAGEAEGTWMVNAGRLAGLAPGSLLEVFPSPGSPDPGRSLGFVEVIRGEMLQAEVRPAAHQGRPAPESLPEGGRCEPAYYDLGDLALRVAVAPGSAGERERGSGAAILAEGLRRSAGEAGDYLRWVDDPAEAEWLIDGDSSGIWLAPASGQALAAGEAELLRGGGKDAVGHGGVAFGPAPGGEDAAPWMLERLQRIARARNLLQLASEVPLAPEDQDAPRVAVEVRILETAADRAGTPVRWSPAGRVLRTGDRVAFHLENRSEVAVDVTLLFVDSSFGIQAFFPERGRVEDNRLPPGGTLLTPAATITDATLGLEHLVAIVARAEGAPVDFSILEQSGIGASTLRGAEDKALQSPLGQLLRHALHGQGTTRGLARAETFDHSIHVISWRVEERGD